MGATVRGGNYVLSDTDVATLGWLNRVTAAQPVHIAERFDITESAARKRLARLGREGLVQRQGMYDQAGAYLPTAEGADASGVDLPAPRWAWGTHQHTLAVTGLVVAYECAGRTVVTDREIKSDQRRQTEDGLRPAWSVSTGQVAGQDSWHAPDLAVTHPDGTVEAVEVELTRKAPHRVRRAIMAMAVQGSPYDEITYSTTEAKLGNFIHRIAEKVSTDPATKGTTIRIRSLAKHAAEYRRAGGLEDDVVASSSGSEEGNSTSSSGGSGGGPAAAVVPDDVATDDVLGQMT